MLNAAAFVINYVIDMGASVMLPIVIAIISIAIGIKVGKAVRSGLMIGVGFVGMGLIVDMMNAEVGPAAQAMSERFGLSLSAVDVGWPGMSPITWASPIATVAIPVAIGVNILMLLFKLTKTVNVDVWNIWHMTFTGAIAYAVTGNFAVGILGVVIHAAISYKLGDLWAPILSDYFELDGLTAPHGTSAYMAPFACLIDWIIDRIPGLNKIDLTADTLQEKVGVLAEPVVIGGILGTAIGFLAGYDAQSALPLTERAKELMNAKFNGAEFYIGLDPAILLGDATVVSAGLIFIPLTLLFAVILPGNTVLPFGDLATIGFFIAIAVGVHKGNLFRSLISGSVIMIVTLLITNQTVAWTTQLAVSTGSAQAGSIVAAMDQGGCPITYIFTSLFTRENVFGLILAAAVYALCMVFAVLHSRKRAAELEADEA